MPTIGSVRFGANGSSAARVSGGALAQPPGPSNRAFSWLRAFLLLTAAAPGLLAGAPRAEPQPIYRFFNGADHFYTASCEEAQTVLLSRTYHYEADPTFYVELDPKPGMVKFYRLYNGNEHFYTTSEKEKANFLRGWHHPNVKQMDEGILGYVYPTQSDGAVKLLRTYAHGDVHFYTVSQAEYDNAVAKFGHRPEGPVAWVPATGAQKCLLSNPPQPPPPPPPGVGRVCHRGPDGNDPNQQGYYCP